MKVDAADTPLTVELFLDLLKQKYQADPNLKSSWPAESLALSQILPLVLEKLPNNYSLRKPLGIGGSGIVAALHDDNLNTERALKIARPSPGKEVLLTQLLLQENSEPYEALTPESYKNIRAGRSET